MDFSECRIVFDCYVCKKMQKVRVCCTANCAYAIIIDAYRTEKLQKTHIANLLISRSNLCQRGEVQKHPTSATREQLRALSVYRNFIESCKMTIIQLDSSFKTLQEAHLKIKKKQTALPYLHLPRPCHIIRIHATFAAGSLGRKSGAFHPELPATVAKSNSRLFFV